MLCLCKCLDFMREIIVIVIVILNIHNSKPYVNALKYIISRLTVKHLIGSQSVGLHARRHLKPLTL